MKRRILAVAVAIVALLLPVALAGQASAAAKSLDPCDLAQIGCAVGGVVEGAGQGCQGPPPAAPDLGVQSWLTRRPDPIPKTANPLWPGAETTIYEQYGLGWARWRTCDLNASWMPDAANVTAQADTGAGSWLLSVTVFATALYAGVVDVAMDPGSWLGWMRAPLEGVVDGIRDGLTDPMIQVLILVLVVALLWHARKGEISKVVTAVGMVVLVGVGVTVVTADPFRVVEDGSQVTAQVVGGVSSSTAAGSASGNGQPSDPATQAISRVVDVVIYDAWLQGMFGSSDSATAEEFGEKLLLSGSLSWEETEKVRAGDKEIVEKKQKAWTDVMTELKQKDPEAYEYATGRGEGRFWAALRANAAMLCVIPILLVGALVILAVPLLLLISVVWLLVAMPLAMFPSQSALSFVRAPLLFGLRAIMNAVVMGVAGAIQLLFLAGLFDPAWEVPVWLALVLMGILTVGLWVVTRKYRRIVPTQKAWGAAKGAVRLGAAAYTGGALAIAERKAYEEAERRRQEEEAAKNANEAEGEDSAHAERAQPMLAIESGPLPHEKEAALLMESEVLAAKARLTQVPTQRKAPYEPGLGAPLTAVPGVRAWTPPEPTREPRVVQQVRADERPAPTGWPRPETKPRPSSEPTGWPRPQSLASEPADADVAVAPTGLERAGAYDSGGVEVTIWTPTTGHMSLEESYTRVQSPAIEIEPVDSFVPVAPARAEWSSGPERQVTIGEEGQS